MGDDEEAKDVLQDAFIEAFSKLHTLEREVTFPAWLKRIVVNKSINALRKKKDLPTGLEEDIEFPETEEKEEILDKDIIRYRADRIMWAADKISKGCKTVFNLYLFDGYDHKEIGQILSITESASKAQYSKAKSKIRKILEANAI